MRHVGNMRKLRQVQTNNLYLAQDLKKCLEPILITAEKYS